MQILPQLFLDLGQNVFMILAFVYIYSQFLPYLKKITTYQSGLVNGLIFSAIALIVMQFPVQLGEGLPLDSRNILVAFSGIFGGWLAGMVATFIVSGFRVALGGVGIIPGILIILFSAVIGVSLHYLQSKNTTYFESLNSIHFLGVGALIAIFGILISILTLPLPLPVILALMVEIIPSVLLFHIFAAVLIGSLLNLQVNTLRIEKEKQRIEREKIEQEVKNKLEQEAQFKRVQSSLGTLAGGIAHDFNNLLAIIAGNLFLIEEGL